MYKLIKFEISFYFLNRSRICIDIILKNKYNLLIFPAGGALIYFRVSSVTITWTLITEFRTNIVFVKDIFYETNFLEIP